MIDKLTLEIQDSKIKSSFAKQELISTQTKVKAWNLFEVITLIGYGIGWISSDENWCSVKYTLMFMTIVTLTTLTSISLLVSYRFPNFIRVLAPIWLITRTMFIIFGRYLTLDEDDKPSD